MQSITYILPELFLSVSIMTLLMVGVFVKRSFKLVISFLYFYVFLVITLKNQVVIFQLIELQN